MNLLRNGRFARVGAFTRTPTFIGYYLASWWFLGVVTLSAMTLLRDGTKQQVLLPDQVQLVTVFLGALGAILGCTMDFIGHKALTPRSYLLRPAVGSLMALFIYFALRSGVFALSGNQPASNSESAEPIRNANLFFFFAVMAGLFSRAAYAKLEQLSLTLFSVDENGREDVSTAPTTELQAGSHASGNSSIVCRLAQSDDEREQAFRLRYRVLVEEEGWQVESQTSPGGPIVADVLDSISLIAVARTSDRRITATVRTTPLDRIRDQAPEMLSRLLPDDLGSSLTSIEGLKQSECSYTSRFVVRPRRALVRFGRDGRPPERHSVATAIASFLYCEGIERGIKVDFIRCFVQERRLYERLGYRLLLPAVPTVGWRPDSAQRTTALLFLVTLDRDHLESVRSPLARYAPRGRQQEADRIREAIEAIGRA